MSQRLQAKSRLLFRFLLSHRILFITLVAMLVLAGVGISSSSAVKSTLSVITGNPAPVASRKTNAAAITVHADGRGKPFLNFRNGHSMEVAYRGDSRLTSALQNGAAQARSLASADFDRNGTPDVVAGYAFNGTGVIAFHRGNPDAFAPADDSVFVRMQQGFDPPSLLPGADVYAVPVSPDFLVTGSFTHDSEKDVLFAAKGGALYLMAGNGAGRLGDPQQIDLPGPVTALAAGEFRAADGFTDVAVGVSGPAGESVLIFDAAEGLSNALAQYQLPEPATGIEIGGLDDDPFMDVAVAAGSEVLIVHGWGRKEQVTAASREERIPVASGLRGLAVGEFAWDRQGRSEIAALAADGTVHVVQNAKLDRRPFSPGEAAQRTRGNLKHEGRISLDIESAPSWKPGRAHGWSKSNSFSATSFEGVSSASTKPLLRTKLSYRETDDLMLMGAGQSKLEIMSPLAPKEKTLSEVSVASDLASTTLDVESAPVAVLALPRKLNGVTDVLVLDSTSNEIDIVPNAPNTTITVDRTDDPSGAGLTAASACTAVANDCSLRGALQFANLPQNNNTTISLPANTYILSINGTSAGGCDGNTVGDLGANQTMSIVGAGAATTIIRQTGTGPANDGDRVMCMNEPFTLDLVYNFSGFTMVGGRDGTAAGTGTALGGGGIIGGEKGNVLTMTNVVLANNQVTVLGSANIGGGGIQWTGGDLNITNCTIGGTAGPGAYTDRSSTNTANLQAGSGGGIMFTPSAPQHTAATGILTVSGSTISRNTAGSIGSGGGGADLLTFGFAAPGGGGTGSATIGTSTFSNNAANPGNGGAILVESLATTVATTNISNNSAGNRGGGIFVGGASLLLNGTSPSITFTGNTATNGGSSVSTSSAVSVSGTNTTIGGDIEINTLGSWTNNAGSTLAPTNVVVTGGTFTMNNSTMNVSGNLTIGPGPVVGSTFNGNTGTVNIQGNFVLNAGGTPATSLNAGTSTFNFNGTAAQSITNGTAITFFNLTDSNVTNPLTLNNSIGVNGTLNVNGANAILSPVAAAVISGTGTLTGTGTARASRIAATPDFLSQYTITNKTLTNLTIDYNGAGNQTVNNTPAYSHLRISGSGTKTLQGNTTIAGNLNIAAATFAGSTFNFSLGGNWTNAAAFSPGTGTVTFAGSTGIQTLTGNTTFFNLTLNNSGATTNFSNTTTTVGNDLVATAGTMDGGTSTIIFTGVTDNAGSISGAAAKNFHNLQINSPATIAHNAGANITIEGNYINGGTFNQGAGFTTIFAVDNAADGAHTLSGAGTTIFGNVAINASNTVDAGTHSFNVIGPAFTVTGTFSGNAGSVAFNGGVAQSITGDGTKNFSGLLINNVNGVQVTNGAGAVDAFVGGLLTLNTDLTVAAGAILQQGGTSTGPADALGTVRRTDLGATTRSFGNINNQVTINSGTAPTQLDFNLAKATPTGFPAGVRVVPRTHVLTPTGGAGFSATLRLRYIDPTELVGGITESRLVLWKDTTGSDNWAAQGGTVDAVNNHVTHTGITSFSEWAIAEAADLTLSKANNVGGSAVVGQSWNWTLTAANTGSPATFTAGQTIILDNLPNSNIIYGTPTVQNVSNITGSANISCAIVSNDLTCTANGGSVTFDSNLGASSFEVVFSATPQAAGSYQNPRGGGIAQIDPNNLIAESNETNNSPANNTVTVDKANTTTTINSDNPDPSVVGEPVTVTWSVTVNAPGALGAPLTGNVTVSDGTDNCVADVSAGQCNITFTSAGAKSLTATYAGDSNYNGSASTPATPHTVNKADTTTTITSDNPDPSTPGQSVTVQWTTTVNAPGAGTPTGNVTVTVSGGAETCSAPVATGECSLVLNTTGIRTITATYEGDSNFNTSSDTEEHTVCGDSVVTSIADSGAGSLRQIIADSCDNSTITFDLPGDGPHTITLTSGELAVDKNLTIKNDSGESITISGNNASRVFNINSGQTVAIIGLTLTGGTATDGGAISNDGALTIVSSTLTGNAATADGGALRTTATSTSLTLINTTISGNTANGSGGGVIVLGGTATSINSTITNNTADFDDNSLGDGGGIRAHAGTTILKNTIAAGNFNKTGGADVPDDVSGTIDPSSSSNLIATSAGLGPLADNGGPTQTHALLPTSPAIEAGSNDNLPVDTFDLDGDLNTAETLPVDQRGTVFPRVADSADVDVIQTVDIGAFELHPSIQDIADTSMNENTVANVGFNIGDDTGSLIASVTATSSNTTLVPNANLVVSVPMAGSRNLQITPAANQSGTTTITVTVTATNGQTATDTFDLTVNAVNDPPVANNDSYSTDEDTPLVVDAANGVLDNDTDPDSPALTAILVTGPANAQSFTLNPDGSFNYTPNLNFNGSDSFTYKANDGSLDSNVATVTITVNAINDAPTIAINAGITVEEGSINNTITNTMLRVDDVDNTAAQIVFTIGTAPVNGTLKLSGASLTSGSTFTQDDINNNRVTYDHNGSQTTSDSFTFTVSDGAGGTIGLTTFNITIGEVDNAPAITAGGTLNYTENDPPAAIDNTIVVSDVDSANLVSAIVQITGNYANGQDVLSFTNTATITGSFNAGSGTLTLTGTDTVANYQAALRSVRYNNTSENPSTLARTVSWSVNDGTSSSTAATSTINVTAVNDPPVNTVPGPQGTAQNTPLVFSSGAGNQISVADPDAGTNSIQVTLTAANGTLTLSTTSGLSFSFTDANGTGTGDGTADATMTFRGTLADVNAALNGMTFTPTPAFSGAASVTIMSNDLGNTGTGGSLTDTDVVNIQVALNVSIADSQVTEPSSGSVNMVFVVSLNAPAPAGGVSVNFTTQDEMPALNHATAGADYTATSGTVTFGPGEQIKTINVPVLSDNAMSETNETFLVLLSSPVNVTITDGIATGTILIANQPASPILISELRTSGPAGAGDDFVEIYNNTDSAHTVNDPSGGYGLFKMGADCNATPVLIGVIPNSTVIPARGHYLFAGSAYSLANYGGTEAAIGDQTLSQDIESDRNVAIFSTTALASLSTQTRLDAVGFGTNTGGICDLLREGTPLVPLSGSTLEHSYFRDECGKKGNPAIFGLCPTGGMVKDSNVNSEDFVFVDTTGTATPAGQRLGAPGPQNMGSPRLSLSVAALLLDATKGAPTTPNRVREFAEVTNGQFGTLSVRRRFVNNTGANVSQLRFRIVDFSSLSIVDGIADLRAISSPTISVGGIMDSATCAATGTPATPPCTVQVSGTTIEQPPTQSLGGALNSSMGTVTLPTPLAPGASVNVQFLLGVEKTGSFKFFFNIEALP